MFDVDDFVQESIESLQNTIDDVAIIACSGGVDSTVAAVIANKACLLYTSDAADE